MRYFYQLLLLIPFIGFGQTTQEEYNYLTKGYAEQVSKGLDMKRGYILKNISTSSVKYDGVNTREISINALHKVDTGAEDFKALLVITRHSANGYMEYYCVPESNSHEDIWKQFYRLVYERMESYKDYPKISFINFSRIILQMYEASL